MKARSGILTLLVLVFFSTSMAAKGQWVEVRTANFHLIGNTSESETKNVAIRLEQFRHVFGLLFPKIKLNDSVETNVLVFKDEKSYLPFLPKLQDGRPDKNIAGYFLGSEDANYITLSISSGTKDAYETIYHEYIHYLLKSNFDSLEIPPWLNEGLAEFYSTFEVGKNRKVMIGNLRNDHLYFLSRSKLIPLRQFFAIDSYSLHRNGNHSRSVFYAQAWALIHYFAVKSEAEKLTRYMDLAKTMDPETAFKQALGVSYEEMEKILKKYVKRKKFKRLIATLNEDINFDSRASVAVIPESLAFAYFGDLLYRQGEFYEAEDYLKRSLAETPNGVRANTAMGMVKMRLKQFDEAKKYLEKSISSEDSGYFAHYTYAYALSREAMNEGGFVTAYNPGVADKMRASIEKAIKLKPDFVPTYTLYAFINIVQDEDIEKAVSYLNKALSLQPGNESASLNMAQAFVRLKKYSEAEKLATVLMKSSKDEGVRRHAATVLANSKRHREVDQANKNLESGRRIGIGSGGPGRATKIPGKVLTKKEQEKILEEREISFMNKSLAKLSEGDKRVLGTVEQIACNGPIVNYKVRTVDGKIVKFRSNGFQRLELIALTELTEDDNVSCNFRSKDVRAVFNYRPLNTKTLNGTLKAITFVPPEFRFKSVEEIANDSDIAIIRSSGDDEGQVIEIKGGTKKEKQESLEKRQNDFRLAQLREFLRKPREGEVRVVGTIEEIECDSRGFGVALKKGSDRLMFRTKSPQDISMTSFGGRFNSASLRCGGDPPNILVVVTYVPSGGDLSSKGSIVSLEFVSEDPKLDL